MKKHQCDGRDGVGNSVPKTSIYFIKYNSIVSLKQNHTNNLDKVDDITKNTIHVCQHKYDGSNFQIIFVKETIGKEQVVRRAYASRNVYLGDNDFNGYKEILANNVELKTALNNIECFLENSPNIKQINLYGEIYGQRVIRRIRYENDNFTRLVFFNVLFDGVYKDVKFFTEWTSKMNLPIVETFFTGTFEECLCINLNDYKTNAGDIIEGVVVKPYQCKNDNDNNNGTYYKIKNEKFIEIEKVKIKKKLNHKQKDFTNFSKYLNLNRILNVHSKQNWHNEHIFTFVDAILCDALKDYNKDYVESNHLSIDETRVFTKKLLEMIDKSGECSKVGCAYLNNFAYYMSKFNNADGDDEKPTTLKNVKEKAVDEVVYEEEKIQESIKNIIP